MLLRGGYPYEYPAYLGPLNCRLIQLLLVAAICFVDAEHLGGGGCLCTTGVGRYTADRTIQVRVRVSTSNTPNSSGIQYTTSTDENPLQASSPLRTPHPTPQKSKSQPSTRINPSSSCPEHSDNLGPKCIHNSSPVISNSTNGEHTATATGPGPGRGSTIAIKPVIDRTQPTKVN
jgi:hypothetical protein